MSTHATSLQTLPDTLASPVNPLAVRGQEDGAATLPAWKMELNAKVAAHRQRRSGGQGWVEGGPLSAAPAEKQVVGSGAASDSGGREMAARVAAKVAERYAKAPSYSELLAASAAAVSEAAETASVAAEEAHQAARVLRSLAAAADRQESAAQASAEASSQIAVEASPGASAGRYFEDVEPAASLTQNLDRDLTQERVTYPWVDATVEHPEPLPVRGVVPPREPSTPTWEARGVVDAMAEAIVPPVMNLPAKLIEFPRELIAPQKARPRIAEGPLLEEGPSLRIFEVDGSERAGLEGRVYGKEGGYEGARLDSDASLAGNEARLAREDSFGENFSGGSFFGDHSPGDRTFAAGEETAQGYSTGRGSAVLDRPVLDQRVLDQQVLDQQVPDQQVPDQQVPDHTAARASSAPAVPSRRVAAKGVSSPRTEAAASMAPGWQSIRLGEHPVGEALTLSHRQAPESALALPLHVARVSDRVMAALVDAAINSAAFLMFVLVFAACTTHVPAGKAALGGAAVVLVGLHALYQWLFMSYGGATPGMRYAGIAICTFDDANPTRKILRSRVTAGLLAALPLGLGLLWVMFDEDSLGWHDRMTRSYQRSYR